MKILVITDLFPPDVQGGYELRCEETCNWLFENKYQIEVLTTKSPAESEKHPFMVNRVLVKYPLGSTPSHWTIIHKIFFAIRDNIIFLNVLRRTNPDLIYVWNSAGLSRTLIPLIFNSKIRKVVDVSSSWLRKVTSQHGPVYRMLEGPHLKASAKVSASLLRIILPLISLHTIQKRFDFNFNNTQGYFTSFWNKEYHAEYLEKCKEFEVIHTGVNSEEFPYQPKNFDRTHINLLYIGRISKEKGFLLLLRQLEYLLLNLDKQFVLKVVGNHNNDEKKNIEETISKLGLEKHIIFEGVVTRKDLFRHYHHADFTVFPSIWDEPFSRIPLESMACGTPCLSTDNPGSKELFDLNSPLIFLDRKDDGLYRGITPFLADMEEYKKLSLMGRKFIETSFTFDCFIKNVQRKFL